MNLIRPDYEVTLKPDTGWLTSEYRNLWQYRDLIGMLVWRDFVAKYKQTILGPVWYIIQPLLMTLVFAVVFQAVGGISTDGLPPLLFYFCGQLGWNYFAQTFTSTSSTLTANANLFSKVYFPRLVVPIAAAISNLFAFLIQAATFFVLFTYYTFTPAAQTFRVTAYAALLPLVVLYMAVISVGVGLVISAATVKYRDLSHATALITQVWLYATPVIYPLSIVPASWRWVSELNPMTIVVESFRLMLLGTGTVTSTNIAVSAGMGVIVLTAGLLLFGKVERTFVDTL